MFQGNKKIYNTWFEAWLTSHALKFMDQPKRFQSNRDVKMCYIVLFIKKDGSLVSPQQSGLKHQLDQSKDGLIQKVVAKYQNHNESVDRFTTYAVCEAVLIHPIDALQWIEELGNTAYTNGVVINMNKQK